MDQSDGFLVFWDRYPRHEAKKDATKAWMHVVKDAATVEKILAALEWQVPMFRQRERQFIPLPATWLRGERWEDERPTTTRNPVIEKLPDWQKRALLIGRRREA